MEEKQLSASFSKVHWRSKVLNKCRGQAMAEGRKIKRQLMPIPDNSDIDDDTGPKYEDKMIQTDVEYEDKMVQTDIDGENIRGLYNFYFGFKKVHFSFNW